MWTLPAPVLILHDPVPPDAAPEVDDTLVQAAAVRAALTGRGRDVATAAVRGEPAEMAAAFARATAAFGGRRPVAFNLVESPEGRDFLASRIPEWLRAACYAFTGADAAALDAANDKIHAKHLLRRAGLSTPAFWPPLDDNGAADTADAADAAFAPGVYIVKPAREHASAGMDDASVVAASSPEDLRRAMAAREAVLPGHAHFAEMYVDGREFNIGFLETPTAVRALPPAEIVFADFPPGKPRIVGYAAKWRESSFEYRHTRRRLAFPPADGALLARLEKLAGECWTLFGTRGYARVDFRVDAAGAAWILEVNANPCLSPDGGFAAMLEAAGIPYAEAVDGLVEAATRRL